MDAKFGITLYDLNMNDSVAKSFTSVNRDKGPEFWLALIKRIFIDTPKYVVKGIPSLAKQQEDTRLDLITRGPMLEALLCSSAQRGISNKTMRRNSSEVLKK